MALGEHATFEFNRFLMDYRLPNAMTITCETDEEALNFFEFLKEADEFDNDLLISMERIRDIFMDSENWINFYCHNSPHNDRLLLDVVSDEGCESETFPSDYYYKDVVFIAQQGMEISKVDLLDFLKG